MAAVQPPPPPVPPDAVGRLRVERLPARAPPPPPAPSPSPQSDDEDSAPLPFANVRLRVVAEAVALSRFATALAEALHINVVVWREALGLPVVFGGPDVTAAHLLLGLGASGIGYLYDPASATLALASEEAIRESRRARQRWCCPSSLETRLITLPPGQPYAEVARYFCDRMASSRGTADVVAGRLIVRDAPENLNQLELLIDTLAGRPQPPRPARPLLPLLTPLAEATPAPAASRAAR